MPRSPLLLAGFTPLFARIHKGCYLHLAPVSACRMADEVARRQDDDGYDRPRLSSTVTSRKPRRITQSTQHGDSGRVLRVPVSLIPTCDYGSRAPSTQSLAVAAHANCAAPTWTRRSNRCAPSNRGLSATPNTTPPAKWPPECVTNLPSWQCRFDSRRPAPSGSSSFISFDWLFA